MQKDNTDKMASMKISKLMITMGIPMILSMMLQAVYNIVDSAFVGRIKGTGEASLNALTLAFPVQMLIVAVGIGTGVGLGALLSKSLGQNNIDKADRVAGTGIFLGIIIWLLCVLFGIFGVKPYINSQTNDVYVAKLATEYLQICCIISFGMVLFGIFEKMLQSMGNSLYSTIAQITGAVVNIVLDPVMIFSMNLGVKGAAYATVIGQIISLIMAVIFHYKKDKAINKSIKYIRPSKSIIKEIYKIGVPAIIAQALMSVMTYGLNIILGKISNSAVTAYGLYYKVQQFVLFAAFGLRDAITPIVSFSHGMQNKKRINEGIKCGIIYTAIIMIAGTVLLETLAGALAKMFGIGADTGRMYISAMRIISAGFVFAGANIAFQGVFQALDGGMESLIVSVLRQIVFVLPVAYLLSLPVRNNSGKIWLVWLTFIFAEGMSLIISLLLMKKIRKNVINNSQILEKIAEETGFSKKIIEDQGEYSPSKSIFSYAFVGRDATGSSISDKIYNAQSEIIRELAKKESFVIIGRCADYILRDNPDAVHIFIHGDEAVKKERIMKLYNKTEKEAVDMMRDMDKKRKMHYNYYTEGEWGKATNYTMTLNSSKLGFDKCIDIISEL